MTLVKFPILGFSSSYPQLLINVISFLDKDSISRKACFNARLQISWNQVNIEVLISLDERSAAIEDGPLFVRLGTFLPMYCVIPFVCMYEYRIRRNIRIHEWRMVDGQITVLLGLTLFCSFVFGCLQHLCAFNVIVKVTENAPTATRDSGTNCNCSTVKLILAY